MSLPLPTNGLVIRYSYLWHAEYTAGRDEGQKDRPCVVILVSSSSVQGEHVVTVLPITHTPPRDPAFAIEIPTATKVRLGLDDQRSWVMLTEANRFFWPGPDLRPKVPGQAETVAFGHLPYRLTATLQRSFLTLLKAKRSGIVRRTET